MASYQEKRHTQKGSICKPLPNDVRNVLRSGIAITSVVQCVEELVYNAIDAEATKITVTVDLESFQVKVEDNGTGISKSDFDVIGVRHTTSKCSTVADLNTLHYFGYRGEALASIIDLSAGVELYTRTTTQTSTQPYYRKFKNGQSSGTTLQVSDFKRPIPGTTIIVHNLLAKLPVRQKRIDPNLEAEDIKKSLEQIYLISPNLLLSLEVNGRRIFYTYSVKSVAEGFKHIYPKLREGTIYECFFNFDCFFFQGWFSRETHHSKSLQYVYVNRRFVSRCKIHRSIDLELGEVIGTGVVGNKNKKNSTGKDGTRTSPRAADKYPIFILSIQAPYTECDMTLEPKKALVEFKNWQALLKGLEGIVLKLKTELTVENKGVVVKSSSNARATRQSLADGEPGNVGSIHDMKRAVHSRVARRERRPGSPVFDSEGEDSPLGETGKGFKSYQQQDSDDEEMKSPDSGPINNTKASKLSQFKPKDKLRLLGANIKSKEVNLKVSKRKKGEEPVIHGYKKLRLLNPEPNSTSVVPSKTLLQSINERMPSFLRSETTEAVEPLKPWNPQSYPENRKTELRNRFNRLSVSAQDSEYQHGVDEEQDVVQPFGTAHELNENQVEEVEKNRRRSEWLDSDEDNEVPSSRQAPRPRSDPRNKDPMVQVAQSLAEDFKAPVPNFVPDPHHVLRSTNSTLSEFYNTFISTTEQYQSSKVIINAILSNENGQKNAMICASETRQQRNAYGTSRFEQQNCLLQEQLVSPNRNTLYLSPDSLEYINNWLLYTLQYPINTDYSPVTRSPCVTPMGPNCSTSDLDGVRDMGPPNTKQSSGSEENSQELLSFSQREVLNSDHVQHTQANQPAFYPRGEMQHQTLGQSQQPTQPNLPTFYPRNGQHSQQVQQNQPSFNLREMQQTHAQTQQSHSNLPPLFQPPHQSQQSLTRPNPNLPPKDIFDFGNVYNFNFPINAPTPAPFRTRPLRPIPREPEGFIVQQVDQNSQQRTSLQLSQPNLEPDRRLPEATGSNQQSGLPYFPQAQPTSTNSAQNALPWRSVFDTEKYLRPPPPPYVPMVKRNLPNPNSYRGSEDPLPVFPRSEIEGRQRQYQPGFGPDSYQYTSAYADNINSQYFSSSARQSTSFDYPPPETMRQSSGYGTMSHSMLDLEERSFIQPSPPLPTPINTIPNHFSGNKPDLPDFELTPIPDFNEEGNRFPFDGERNDSPSNEHTERQEPISPMSDSKENDAQENSASEGLSTYFQANMKLDTKPVQFSTESPRNGLPPLLPFKPNSDFNGEWNDDQIFDMSSSWENWDCEVTKDAIGEEWLVTEDKDGCEMYINLKTGVSSYDMRTKLESRRLTSKEAAQINPNFSYNWLRRHFPKGSKFWKPENKHLLKNGNIELAKNGNTILGLGIQQCLNGTVDELMASKWREGVLMESNKIGSNSNTGIVRVAEYWERPLGTGEVPVVNLNAPEIHFSKSLTNSCKFSKADLKLVKVIAQVDKKFIVARAKVQSGTDQEAELLILFDQHAVHERIRLEMLMAEIYIETSPGTKEITSVCISPPIQLSFSDTEVRILVNYVNDFEGIGIKFKQIDSTTVNILSAPKCFAEKIGNEIKSARDESISRLIHNLVQEKVHNIIDTKGSSQTMPKTIFNILCSQACRGAIKFGDELTLEACEELIDKLKDCKMPFQCAHGRPVLTPLLDLNSIQPTDAYS